MSEPIPSSTVVLLRDTPEGMKVLLLRRNSDIAYGGSWVFPGGRINPSEHALAGENPLVAARLAGARETREEAGIDVDPAALVYFAHWTTPVIRPKRFSTWFFLASVTQDAVEIDGGEIHAWAWYRPDDALQAQRDHTIELPPPTFVTLTQLRDFTNSSDALMHFSQRAPLQIQPTVVKTPGAVVYLYNDDAGHATADPIAAGPRHRLVQPADGPWEYIVIT